MTLAVELWRAAVYRGLATAQNNLDIAYAVGRGVERGRSAGRSMTGGRKPPKVWHAVNLRFAIQFGDRFVLVA